MKVISAISLIYLLIGVPGVARLLGQSTHERIVGGVYLACILLGVAGTIAAFRDRPNLFRTLSLWAIGIASLIYSTNDVSIIFPTYFHVPVTFGGSYSNGSFTRFGVDVIPSVLFLLTWFTGKTTKRE